MVKTFALVDTVAIAFKGTSELGVSAVFGRTILT